MSPDPLDLIWRSADVASPLFAGDETAAWSPSTEKALTELGLLRAGKTASHVICDACAAEHEEKVTAVSYPGGRTRFFIVCPENGRIEVERERMLQWSVDFIPVLNALAEGLGLASKPEEVVPERVWKIGRVSLVGRSRIVWAARGLSWPDAQALSEFLPTGKSPVLFFLGLPPTDGVVKLRPDSIIEIRHVLRLSHEKLLLDRTVVEDQLSATGEASGRKPPKKRASRAAAIDALEKAIIQHLIAARDHAHIAVERGDPPELLPRPEQKFFAAQLNISESAVSRSLKDPKAHTLKMLWEMATDLDQVLKYGQSRRR